MDETTPAEQGAKLFGVTSGTLVMAIQAVAAEIRGLRESVSGGEGEAEDYQLIEDFEAAAEDLKEAYEAAAATIVNLPPYGDLVG